MTKHQKALSSPKTFPIERKNRSWAIKPSAGPHPKDNCIPLGIVLRDILKYTENVSEVKKVLKEGQCDVDCKRVRDYRFPLGIFDTLRVGKEYFRLIPSKKGFKLIEISKKDSREKICRIEDKKSIGDGKLQLNLKDGRNITVEEDKFRDLETGSSVVIGLPEQEIKEVIDLEEGQEVMITEGKNRGDLAKFKEKKILRGSKKNRVIVLDDDEEVDLPEGLAIPIDSEKIQLEAGD